MIALNTQPLHQFGPLAALAGTWEGEKGHDTAPSDSRGTETNLFKERAVFVPFGPVNNHEQTLYGLKYSTTAWRLGEKDSFHEEIGYWLWDAKERQVLRCFMIPRGVTILAGGTVDSKATQFELKATAGSDTYGICSNPFLDREFKTVLYTLKVSVKGDVFTYEEDTQIEIRGHNKLFHHIDKNTLQRIE